MWGHVPLVPVHQQSPSLDADSAPPSVCLIQRFSRLRLRGHLRVGPWALLVHDFQAHRAGQDWRTGQQRSLPRRSGHAPRFRVGSLTMLSFAII
jgi:hypothetical protein